MTLCWIDLALGRWQAIIKASLWLIYASPGQIELWHVWHRDLSTLSPHMATSRGATGSEWEKKTGKPFGTVRDWPRLVWKERVAVCTIYSQAWHGIKYLDDIFNGCGISLFQRQVWPDSRCFITRSVKACVHGLLLTMVLLISNVLCQ